MPQFNPWNVEGNSAGLSNNAFDFAIGTNRNSAWLSMKRVISQGRPTVDMNLRTGLPLHVSILQPDVFVFLWRLQAAEAAVKRQVIKDLQPSRDKKGQPQPGRLDRNNPLKTGLNEAPTVRATPSRPAAAERSSGATTAIV